VNLDRPFIVAISSILETRENTTAEKPTRQIVVRGARDSSKFVPQSIRTGVADTSLVLEVSKTGPYFLTTSVPEWNHAVENA